MSGRSNNPMLRNVIITRGLEFLVMVVVAAGIVFMYEQLRFAQARFLEQVAAINAEPQLVTLAASLKNELRLRNHDVQRIQAMVPTRDNVGLFIETLEQEARRYNLVLQVPEITEEERIDEQGRDLFASSVFRPVRLHIVAGGRASDLLTFLHDVEHLPMLVSLVSWGMDTQGRIPVGFVSRPTGLAPGAPSEATATPAPRAVLEADLILQVWNEKRSSQ